jgi:outer membrane protein OmpA-like peptidoglycan-associated protein
LAFGANIRVGQKTDLNGELSYRFGGDDYKDNMQIGIGFIHRFGKISMEEVILPEEVKELDADGDGVPDDLDLCPQTPGLEAFFGCPDTDGDGIQDSMDECPEEPGSKELKGCPDTDKDGVSDKDDECPNVAGTLANKGCPESKDTDGDGIVDDKDACPNTAGVEQFNGCPDTDKDGLPDYQDDCPYTAGVISLNGCPDRDGDGVADKDDRCPDQAGRVSNFGCPDLKIEDREVLEFAVQAVEFDFGKATLRRSSFSILNKVADVIKRYPAYSLRISGHTDNVGDASRNQKLSEQRARSCYEYLNTKGVPTSRMNYIGYGEERPIEDNDTESGRARNRRVEFDVYVK